MEILKNLKNVKSGVIEQGFLSLLNFGIVIFLSSLLSATEFAHFVIIYSSISLVFLISTGFWGQPIPIFLPTKYKNVGRFYFRYLSLFNVITSILFSIFVFLIVHHFIRGISLGLFIVSTLVACSWNQYELIRKKNFAENSINSIAISSGLICFVYFFLNLIIYTLTGLDTFITLFLLFISYLIGITFTLLNECKKNSVYIGDLRDILLNHWTYSKWSIGGLLAYWVASQGYFLLAAPYLSDKEIGALRATMNFLGTVNILLQLFENWTTTKASKIFYEEGYKSLKKYINSIYKRLFFLFISIIIVLGMFSYLVFDMFYGDKYINQGMLILIFSIYQFILGVSRPAVIALRVRINTKPFFVAHVLSAIFTLTIGVILIKQQGDIGAALGILLSGIVFTIIIISSYLLKQSGSVKNRSEIDEISVY